jgi:multiple sugar transport system permease protein
MKNNTRLGGYLFVAPYLIVFTLLILVPTLASVALSFTYFNTVEAPEFVRFENFIQLFTNDGIFMRNALPNTIFFALVVGPAGYFLSFFLAWVLAQVQPGPRKFLALVIYAPSMIGAVLMNVVWRVFFSGDRLGYLNNILISIGVVNEPVQWLQSPDFLIYIMIFVSIWSSMGLGFLAIMAGILNTDRTLYEAAYIDGLKNKFQEIFYITIPSIKPQMLFGAVMAIVGTMNAAGLGIVLSGANPTPQYAGWLIVDHMADFGFKRMEMGYASALSLVMLLLVYAVARVALKTFREKE